MGLAVYNGIILDLNFPPCCFKKLLASLLPPGNAASAVELAHAPDEKFCTPFGKQVEMPKFLLDDLTTVMPVCTDNTLFCMHGTSILLIRDVSCRHLHRV